ncbi:hypothetical protein MUK42_12551 [Musa troglodytarum]|uniref:Uncharacterized protein n=1 Tax=Musa troglodytarum TaxID=320322 RepID=A0A9E7GYH2_9LILI|nr:hypothetical protein MUK42_12551 [Musa troglodytarum]
MDPAAGPASDETASTASNPDALNDAVDGPTRGGPDKRPREKTVAAPSPPPYPSFTHLEGFHLPFALGIPCRSLVRSLLTMSHKTVITYKRKRSSSQSDLTKARKVDSSEKTEQKMLPKAELDTFDQRFDGGSVALIRGALALARALARAARRRLAPPRASSAGCARALAGGAAPRLNGDRHRAFAAARLRRRLPRIAAALPLRARRRCCRSPLIVAVACRSDVAEILTKHVGQMPDIGKEAAVKIEPHEAFSRVRCDAEIVGESRPPCSHSESMGLTTTDTTKNYITVENEQPDLAQNEIVTREATRDKVAEERGHENLVKPQTSTPNRAVVLPDENSEGKAKNTQGLVNVDEALQEFSDVERIGVCSGQASNRMASSLRPVGSSVQNQLDPVSSSIRN